MYLYDFRQAYIPGRTPIFEKRVDQLGKIKIKNFHSSDDTVIKIKMPGTNWKIFVIQK